MSCKFKRETANVEPTLLEILQQRVLGEITRHYLSGDWEIGRLRKVINEAFVQAAAGIAREQLELVKKLVPSPPKEETVAEPEPDWKWIMDVSGLLPCLDATELALKNMSEVDQKSWNEFRTKIVWGPPHTRHDLAEGPMSGLYLSPVGMETKAQVSTPLPVITKDPPHRDYGKWGPKFWLCRVPSKASPEEQGQKILQQLSPYRKKLFSEGRIAFTDGRVLHGRKDLDQVEVYTRELYSFEYTPQEAAQKVTPAVEAEVDGMKLSPKEAEERLRRKQNTIFESMGE